MLENRVRVNVNGNGVVLVKIKKGQGKGIRIVLDSKSVWMEKEIQFKKMKNNIGIRHSKNTKA